MLVPIRMGSIESSVNLGDTLLRIAREWKVAETWFLARLFILQLSFISQILGLIYWTITIFTFDHMTDENREYLHKLNLEKLTVRLGLTTVYFPIFRQARPDFLCVFLYYGGISMTKFNNQELISNYPNCTCINPKPRSSNETSLCSKSWMHPTEVEGQCRKAKW